MCFLSWDSVYFERALPLKFRTINIRSLHLDGKIGFQISHLKLVVEQEQQKRYKWRRCRVRHPPLGSWRLHLYLSSVAASCSHIWPLCFLTHIYCTASLGSHNRVASAGGKKQIAHRCFSSQRGASSPLYHLLQSTFNIFVNTPIHTFSLASQNPKPRWELRYF